MPKTTTIGFRVPAAMRAALKARSRACGRGVGEIIRAAITRELKCALPKVKPRKADAAKWQAQPAPEGARWGTKPPTPVEEC